MAKFIRDQKYTETISSRKTETRSFSQNAPINFQWVFRDELVMTASYQSANKVLRQARESLKSGDTAAAQQLYNSVLEHFPNNKRAAKGISLLNRQQTKPRSRIAISQEQCHALIALYRQGRIGETLKQSLKLAAEHPNSAFLHNIAGASYAALGQAKDAVGAYSRALELNPYNAEFHNNLGDALNTLGRHLEALSALNRAIAITPDFPEALNNLGNALNSLGRQPEAIPHLKKALKLRPGYPEALNNLGNAFNDLGSHKKAIASFEAALEARPNFADCWRNLTAIKRFSVGDPAIGKIKSALELARNENDKMQLNLALAKVLDDVGEKHAAFDHYVLGNSIRRRQIGETISKQRNLFSAIQSIFADGVPAPLDVEPVRKRPVFVVGMPRSGTSLTEQILASHSHVFGAGELQALRQAVSPALNARSANTAMLCEVRNAYLKSLDAIETDAPVLVDKMPLNFRWIGYIAAALPEASIIHTRRDPIAVSWSIFRTFFPARGLEFTYDLEDIGDYHRLYQDLMAFWTDRLPDRIYQLDYERLTENQEEETRKLLHQCGLSWDQACLDFHKTERTVRSASSVQVRKEMYAGSSEAWRKYEQHLTPLIESLAG